MYLLSEKHSAVVCRVLLVVLVLILLILFIANTVYDTVANGDLSQYALEIQQYMDLGYSEKQAKHLWSVDFGEQLAMTAFSSMIMGGLLSGGNYVKAAKNAPYINKTADTLQQAYNMPREDALKIMINHVLSGESQAETQSLIERANDIVNNLNMLNSQDATANTANLFEGLSEQESAALNQSNLNSQENVANIPNNEYNNDRGNEYGRTDEFRRLQEDSQRMSDDDIQLFHSGSKQIDDGLRGRFSRSVKSIFLEAENNGVSYDNGILSLNAKNNDFTMHEGVNGALFHDVFEMAKNYLKYGELVDLHEITTTDDGIGYNDCYNYLSDDGLSGFSITPTGDLISVFNASGKSGFLRAIAPLVQENAKTLDCYGSENQNLKEIYSSIFGFKTASVMDYNMEYDHDNIAQNHNSPQVAFMVNTDSDVETKYFNKDSYDEAQAYQRSFFNEENGNVAGNETLQEQGSVNTQENVVAEQQSVDNETLSNTPETNPKLANGIFDTSVGTKNNPATQEQINGYVDYAFGYGEEKQSNENIDIDKQKSIIYIGSVSDELASEIMEQGGIDISGYDHALVDNDIRHIRNSHGENTNETYPITADDIKQIPDIINNYDDVLYIERDDGKKGIYYVKRHNGVTYYLEQIPDKRNVLSNKQMIKVPTGTIPGIKALQEAINKKWGDVTAPNDNVPRMYVPDVRKQSPTSNIPNSQPDVKQNSANNNKTWEACINKLINNKTMPMAWLKFYKNKKDCVNTVLIF